MKKKSNLILGIVMTVIILLGSSYAFFVYNKIGKNEIVFEGGKIDIAFTSSSDDKVLVNGMYPKSDKEGLAEGVSYEFTLTGYNESTKDMHYRIYMDDTENNPEGKVRFSDDLIKVAVYKNGELVLQPSEIGDFSKPGIYFDVLKQGSSKANPEINNYEIKLWINEKVRITSTMCEEGYTCFSQEEYPKMFFEKILKVEADFSYDDIGYLTYNANGGTNTPKKTSLATQKITTQKPVLENKAFLGWSTTPDGEVEYKSGDTYTGEGIVLYAIYGDTRNVMNVFSQEIIDYRVNITNVYFINEDIDTLTTRYNNASIKADLTYNNQGQVLGWLENDASVDGIQYYNLYIGSEGVTYLNTGYYLFKSFANLTTIDFTNVDTSMVTSMAYMFVNGNYGTSEFENANTKLKELDLSSFNTSNVQSIEGMFLGLTALTSINLSNFDTSNVKTFYCLFYMCQSLTNLDISNFNTSSITNMNRMFYECRSLKTLDLLGFNTENVTDMAYMFYGCNSIVSFDLSNFDTSNVTIMIGMFEYCHALTKLDLSNFNTGNVTDMQYMFTNCFELSHLDLSNFDTSKVTDMLCMFANCYKLTNLDLSSFNTIKVTNMRQMFYNCQSLVILDISNFDTSEVTDMNRMFYDCSSLINLDTSSFKTGNVTDMVCMFYNCQLLESLDLSGFDTGKVSNMTWMFYVCNNLKTIYVSDNWVIDNVTDSTDMFAGCTNLVGKVSYDENKVDVSMANLDGYFTKKQTI